MWCGILVCPELEISYTIFFQISELKKKLFSPESGPVLPIKPTDSTKQGEEVQRYGIDILKKNFDIIYG